MLTHDQLFKIWIKKKIDLQV